MSVISIETKKFSDLDVLKTVTGSEQMYIHNDEGVKVISVEDLQKDLTELINGLRNVIADNAGAHNSIFRGKNLGTSVTADQYTAISSGEFTDLYIGDYWVINNVQYCIAAFDYFLHTGDTEFVKHHAIIVPRYNLYNAQMNTSNTTSGGYVGSAMYTSNLASAKSTIKAAFSGHVLSHRLYLVNAVSNGYSSGGAWFDSEVDLMTEEMVYGGGVFHPVSTGSVVPTNYRTDKSQLPLFALSPEHINIRQTYWLRDVITASAFALVYNKGIASYYDAGDSHGVRPAFCIG